MTESSTPYRDDDVFRAEHFDRSSELLNFLQALHFVHAGDLSQAGDDGLEVLQVRNIQHDFHAGLAVRGVGGDVFDVALGVANHAGDVLQHAEAVVAEDGELDRVRRWHTVVARPFDVDLAFGFVHQVGDVGAVDRVDGHAFAARDVADDALAADGIAAAGAVDHHVSLAADGDAVVVAEDAAHHAGDGAGLRSQAFGFDVPRDGVRRACGQQLGQHLAGRIFSVTDARHQVVHLAQAIAARDFLQLFVLHVLEGDAVFARFFLDQLAPDFDGALALVNVEPVLDLIARPRGLYQAKPVAAGLVAGLGEDFDDISRVQLVAQGDHASVDLGPDAGVSNLGMNAVGEVDGRSIARKDDNFSFGREGVDLFGIEIDLQRGEKFVGIADIALPLDHLAEPGEALLVLRGHGAVFVFPVGGDALFRHLVHLFGADLDFEGRAVLGDHGGV